MRREQLLRSLKINGRPVRVIAGQIVIPEEMQKPQEERKNESELLIYFNAANSLPQ